MLPSTIWFRAYKHFQWGRSLHDLQAHHIKTHLAGRDWSMIRRTMILVVRNLQRQQKYGVNSGQGKGAFKFICVLENVNQMRVTSDFSLKLFLTMMAILCRCK